MLYVYESGGREEKNEFVKTIRAKNENENVKKISVIPLR